MSANAVYFILAGIAGGVIGGMGLGGGTLLIPLLTVFLNVGGKQAAAINLISFIPMSVVSCVIHAKNKLLDLKKALLVAIPATVTSALASFFAQRAPQSALTKAFAVFLICLAVAMIISRIFLFVSSLGSKLAKYPLFPRPDGERP